jgi:hypothetical protein
VTHELSHRKERRGKEFSESEWRNYFLGMDPQDFLFLEVVTPFTLSFPSFSWPLFVAMEGKGRERKC